MSAARPGPSWLYRVLPGHGCLDLAELANLGSDRPQWTRHFCSWRAFKGYVRGCDEGSRIRYGGWGDETDWALARQEIAQERARRLQRAERRRNA